MIKNILKIILGLFLGLLYGIFMIFHVIIGFILPGKCEKCVRKRFNFFRNTVVHPTKGPILVCRECYKTKYETNDSNKE